jgi:putative colanic acid biosynthesis UDP-glucose lipid carrier transferase
MFINMLTFQQANLYRSWRGRPYSDQLSQLVLAWGGASLITGLVWLLLDLTRVLNATSLLAWFVVTLVTIVILRSVLYGGIRRFRKRGINSKKVLLYGAGRLGQSIATQTERSPETGFQIVGYVDDNPELKGQSINGIPVVGSLADLRETPLDYEIEEIWVALPLSATPKVTEVLEITERHPISVRMFPDLFGMTLLNHSATELLGFPMIDLNVDRMDGLNLFIKNLEDKILGTFFFIIGLPLMAGIALAIRLTSKGPVVFTQRRNGWDGKPFTIYKFRTMRIHEEPPGKVTQATKDDDRHTAVGRWLRRTSFDELPQLLNVLKGEMSLVGPRPHAVEHDDYYSRHINGYMRRSRVRPGITGWAQVNDLRGEVQEIEEMSRRVKHDLYYIEHWSLWFDLRIIMGTLLKLFFSKKAY